MSAPTITINPTSGPAGTEVTVTVVRDTPPTPVTITATSPAGMGVASFTLIQQLQVAVAGGRDLTVVSDDGLTLEATFVA